MILVLLIFLSFNKFLNPYVLVHVLILPFLMFLSFKTSFIKSLNHLSRHKLFWYRTFSTTSDSCNCVHYWFQKHQLYSSPAIVIVEAARWLTYVIVWVQYIWYLIKRQYSNTQKIHYCLNWNGNRGLCVDKPARLTISC